MTLEEFIERMQTYLFIFKHNWETNQIRFGDEEFPNELEDFYEWFEQFEASMDSLEM